MNKDLLKIICCPKCNSDLKYKDDLLTCVKCSQEYIVKDNIPILLDDRI